MIAGIKFNVINVIEFNLDMTKWILIISLFANLSRASFHSGETLLFVL
jgi:uncharacterized protein Smg (DUF494 family)